MPRNSLAPFKDSYITYTVIHKPLQLFSERASKKVPTFPYIKLGRENINLVCPMFLSFFFSTEASPAIKDDV